MSARQARLTLRILYGWFVLVLVIGITTSVGAR